MLCACSGAGGLARSKIMLSAWALKENVIAALTAIALLAVPVR